MSGIDAELSGAETPRIAEAYPEWLEPEAALTAFQPPEGEALIASAAEAEERRYGFRVDTLRFLVKPNTHSEVVRSPAISTIPHSPPWLLGLINLRSNLVPVFDVHHLCSMAPLSAQAKTTVLVLDVGDKAVGIPIDALPASLIKLRRFPQLPPLPEALHGSVNTGYVADGDVWLEFNHDQFFSAVIRKQ
jgi:twitching motility protein PilI